MTKKYRLKTTQVQLRYVGIHTHTWIQRPTFYNSTQTDMTKRWERKYTSNSTLNVLSDIQFANLCV